MAHFVRENMKLVCDRCGTPLSKYEGSWQWHNFMWAHKCPQDHYTMGHAGVAVPEYVYQELVMAKTALLQIGSLLFADSDSIIEDIVRDTLRELSISAIPKKEED